MVDILQRIYEKKMEEVANDVVECFKFGFQAIAPGSKEIYKTFYSKFENGELRIYSSSPVPKFFEKGTKPHIIRPKNKKALAFQSFGSVVGKSGHKYEDGDSVIVKEVKHPGTPPRPFISAALFMAKNKIKNKLTSSSQTPLKMVAEENKLYFLR